MRIRPFAVLSIAVLSALSLAGCAGGGTGTATTDTSPTSTAAPADLCDAGVASGDAVASIAVSGRVGEPPTVSFASPLTIDAVQRAVVGEGTGDPVVAGDLVSFAYTVYDAQTGQEEESSGYTPGSALPTQISSDSGLGQIFGCAPIGTRVVLATPDSEQSPAALAVVDLLGVVPNRATGADQAPVAGFPTVTLASDGTPTIDVTGVQTPDTTQVEVLKKGDGETVASGDSVLVQYTGVLLSDGSVFDSSWANGAPASFSTTQVVAGFGTALVGQTAGSQVVAVIPPAEGYGDTAQGTIPAGSTLVFVVDILAVAHATAAQ